MPLVIGLFSGKLSDSLPNYEDVSNKCLVVKLRTISDKGKADIYISHIIDDAVIEPLYCFSEDFNLSKIKPIRGIVDLEQVITIHILNKLKQGFVNESSDLIFDLKECSYESKIY